MITIILITLIAYTSSLALGEDVPIEYDDKDNIIRITIDGIITTYDYDTHGNIICINCHPDADGMPEYFEYDNKGLPTRYERGALAVDQEFDENNRMTRITTSEGYATFTYDNQGNLFEIKDEGAHGKDKNFQWCFNPQKPKYDIDCNGLIDRKEILAPVESWIKGQGTFHDFTETLTFYSS